MRGRVEGEPGAAECGEEFDHDRDVAAFDPAEGQKGAGQTGRGIGGRLALRIDRPILGDRLAAIGGLADVDPGRGAAGLVEQARTLRVRDGEGERIRPRHRVRRAEQAHQGRRIRARPGDESAFGEPVDEPGELAGGVAVRDRRQADTEAVRRVDEGLKDSVEGEVRRAMAGIHAVDDRSGGVEDGHRSPVDPPGFQSFEEVAEVADAEP